MTHLIIGGASSGKSNFGESLLSACRAQEKYYLATMPVEGEEDRRRVLRHRMMRAEKGFLTKELPRNLSQWKCPMGCAILLECVTTLVANEIFSLHGGKSHAENAVLSGILQLKQRADTLIIITGNVFCDGMTYDSATESYLEVLGEINQHLCTMADLVTEVVCGIPLSVKEKSNESKGT